LEKAPQLAAKLRQMDSITPKGELTMTTRTLINITLCAAISLAASQSFAAPQNTATSNKSGPTIGQLLDSGTTAERGAKIGATAAIATGIIGGFGIAAVRAGRGTKTPAPTTESDANLREEQFGDSASADASTSDSSIAVDGLDGATTPVSGADSFVDGRNAAAEAMEEAIKARKPGEAIKVTIPADESASFENGFRSMVNATNAALKTDGNSISVSVSVAKTSDHQAFTDGMDQATEDIKTGAGESVADQSLDFRRGYSFGIAKAERAAEAAGNTKELDKLEALRKTAFGSDGDTIVATDAGSSAARQRQTPLMHQRLGQSQQMKIQMC
jgi:hypothetical protein